MLRLTDDYTSGNNVQPEYRLPAYIPIVKTRGFPQEGR